MTSFLGLEGSIVDRRASINDGGSGNSSFLFLSLFMDDEYLFSGVPFSSLMYTS